MNVGNVLISNIAILEEKKKGEERKERITILKSQPIEKSTKTF